MAKMTKAQAKRMVTDIRQKTSKLYLQSQSYATWHSGIISVADMAAIEKLCAKWIKRIG